MLTNITHCVIITTSNNTGGNKVDLKASRKAKRMRQTDLATIAGISSSMVVKLERGERKPSVKVAKKIAAVLGFDWTEFFK